MALPASATAVPATPTGLSASVTTETHVALRWTPSATDVTDYRVYRNGSPIKTLDGLSATYIDKALTPGTSYKYRVAATDATGTSAQSAEITAVTGTTTTALSACTTTPLASNTRYKLTADLTAPVGGPCLSAAESLKITLDCQGHTITQNSDAEILRFSTVNRFLVQNCKFQQNGSAAIVKATTSHYGYFAKNTFTASQLPATYTSDERGYAAGARRVEFADSSNMIVGGADQANSFKNSWLLLHGTDPTTTWSTTNSEDAIIPGWDGKLMDTGTTDSYVGHNTFLQSGPSAFASIHLHKGDGSVVAYNTINGGYTGGSTESNGADDAIILTMNDGVTVSRNWLRNTWDAGIDSGGTLNNSKIDNNTFSGHTHTAFGSYHRPSIENTKFRGNNVSDTPKVFFINKTGPTWSKFWLPDNTFHLENNLFSNNALFYPTEPVPGYGTKTGAAIWFGANATGPDAYPIETGGNVFKDNDFSAGGALDFVGNNIANYSQSTGNACPASTQVQCGGAPVVTQPTPAAKVSSTSYVLSGKVDPRLRATTTKIQWGTTTSYGNEVPAQSITAASGVTSVQATITGLTPGQSYYYRVVATNELGTTAGSGRLFAAS